jgi:hypothetical protein
MGLVILIAAVGIGTAVQRENQLERSVIEFANKVYEKDVTDSLDNIVYEFLDDANVGPLVSFSTSSAANIGSFKCSPIRLFNEFQVKRYRVAYGGTYPRFFYICGADVKTWQAVYKELFESTGVYVAAEKNNGFTISSNAECIANETKVRELEQGLFYHAYKDILEKFKLLPVPKGIKLYSSNEEALEDMKLAGSINESIFTQCPGINSLGSGGSGNNATSNSGSGSSPTPPTSGLLNNSTNSSGVNTNSNIKAPVKGR